MKNEVLVVKIGMVEPHPTALMSYCEKDLTGLRITMNFVGELLDPIKCVKRNNLYLAFDGISRLKVSEELNWPLIKIELCDYTDVEIKDQIVLRNFKTKRSIIETCNQAELFLNVLGKTQGKKRERIGDLTSGEDDFGLVGKDRFQIACSIIGCEFSPSTLRRLFSVRDFERDGDEEVKGLGLMDKVEQGSMKPNRAYALMNRYKEEKKDQGTNTLVESLEYEEGNHFKLYNSTCEDLSNVPDDSIDLSFESSPYFRQRKYPDGTLPEGIIPHGEEPTVDEYIKTQVRVFRAVRSKLKDTGSLIIVIADSYEGISCMIPSKLIVEMGNDGWYFVDEWIWAKNQKPQSLTKRLQPTYEKMLHFVKDPKKYYFREFKNWIEGNTFGVYRGSNDGEKGVKKEVGWSLKRPHERFRNFLDVQKVAKIFQTSIFNWSELKEIDPKFRHVAPFPSYIPLLPILMLTKPGDTVLDVYSGTGSTSAVALQLGRNAIGYDTDTLSHNFAIKRLTMVEQNLPSNQEIIDLESDYMTAA
jgi:site-specific DNA-methyltransferase (adenine-specific)